MGKGNRKRKKQKQRTTEERDLVKEKVMERFERAEAERQAKLPPKYFAARAGSDPPPILGEPDAPVRAPLKPKPHLRSGAIALLEPEPEYAFLTVIAKLISK